MNKEQMSEQIQREVAEYRTLTTEAEKEKFWQQIRQADALLIEEERALINEVIYDDLQQLIIETKELLRRDEPAKAHS